MLPKVGRVGDLAAFVVGHDVIGSGSGKRVSSGQSKAQNASKQDSLQCVGDDPAAEHVGLQSVALFVEHLGGDVAGKSADHRFHLVAHELCGEAEVRDF